MRAWPSSCSSFFGGSLLLLAVLGAAGTDPGRAQARDEVRRQALPQSEDGDGDGWSVGEGDCNDGDPTIHPDATELCNGTDDDCDGTPDDGDPGGGAACGSGVGECTGGVTACVGGMIECVGEQGPELEGCDGVDNDCDGQVDEGLPTEEACNGVDDDCDMAVDEGLGTSAWYKDVDGDGYGDPSVEMQACGPPEGFVAQGADCDDGNDQVHPAAVETCNGIDDDCDAFVDGEDEGLVCVAPDPIDVDGNGAISALTDTLLLLRWAFGLTGASLVNGAVAPNCTRCTAEEIIEYIEQTLLAPDI